MTGIEQRAMEIVTAYLPKIAKELERVNRLKALEIKMKLNPYPRETLIGSWTR